MARIYISYNQKDTEVARSIAEGLKNAGHTVAIDMESLAPGQDWRAELARALKESEAIVVLLSQSALDSPFVLSELGAARAYASETQKMLVIPVVIDGIEIPPVIKDLQCIYAPDRNISHIIEEINRAISISIGLRAAKESQAEAAAERIVNNAAEYIEEALGALKSQEDRYRFWGTTWYFLGFMALAGGLLLVSSWSIQESGQAHDWIELAVHAIKTAVVIGVVAACAKYSFSLGKSFMNESLKSADRSHAIAFGKFYLRVFGGHAKWDEIKDAFQHWNIDRDSSFFTLESSHIDPQVLELFKDLLKTVASRQPEK